MDREDDGDDDDDDDDDGDSSGDDANGEDEDVEEEEEEDEHLPLADSAIIIPVDEPVSPPEGIEPIIPPPSTDITIGARINVRPQTSISLPPEAEVERLLAMTTPSPSPPILLSPPSEGERLTRCTAPPAHSSPLPMPSPLLPSSGCPTQIQTLRIASTQALIDAVTTKSPSPPLPPSLYIPPPVDHRDDIPESEDTWVDSAEVVPEIAPMTMGEVNTRVIKLAKLHEHDTQDLYALLKDAQDRDSMDGGGGGLCFPRGLGSLDRIEVHETRFQMQQAELAALRETDRRRQAHMVETLRVIRDMRREMTDMQAELLALREQHRRARQSGPEARIPDHQDASWDADSVVGLTWWIEKMESVFNISGCAIENQVKFATCTLLGAALTWWNDLTLICTKFVANETKKVDKYISGLPDNIYRNVKSARPKTLDETIELANDLMDQKLHTYAERQSDNKRKADDSSRNNHGHQQRA
ncbi:hypothetical protein Tco_0477793 [Tanacetum coccineum]